MRGIDDQVAKAEKAVAGKVPVKRNRFITLSGATKAVNPPATGGQGARFGRPQGLRHQPARCGRTVVIDAYLRLFQIEKSLGMSKHDLRTGPIHHHKRESIDAHLTIVFAALAISRWLEDRTRWSVKKFVRTARRHRTVTVRVGDHIITAADSLPDDLRNALKRIHADWTATPRSRRTSPPPRSRSSTAPSCSQ